MNNELGNGAEALTTISTDNLINIAYKAEARIEAVKKLKGLSLRVTNYQDWVDQNGKPYLQTSGGEKIARLFGISWTVGEPQTQQDGNEGHYMVTYKGTFTLGNTSIECIGTRSSKDGFFKKYKEGKEQAPSTIDIGDVVKSAYTNLIGNGITRLLGIRNLTYDDLAESGIDVSKITKVEYKTKVKTPQSKSDPKNEVDEMMIGIKEVTIKTGKKKDGSEWTKYHIKDTIGGDWTTFDKKIAEEAKKAKESGYGVVIKTETKGEYVNIVSMTPMLEPEEPLDPELSKLTEQAAKEAGI